MVPKLKFLFYLINIYLPILLVIFCIYFNAINEPPRDITSSNFITQRQLYKGDVISISINDILFPKELQMKSPPMVVSMMIDKTLGYEIGSTYPFLTRKNPVLYLKTASNATNTFWSPSTVTFGIDFTMEKQSSTDYFAPNNSIIVRNNKAMINQTDHIIKSTLSNENGTTLYESNFVLSIISKELEGLYTFHWHCFESLPISVKVIAKTNSIRYDLIFEMIFHGFQFLVYLFIIFMVRKLKWHILLKKGVSFYPIYKCCMIFVDIFASSQLTMLYAWRYNEPSTTYYKYNFKSDSDFIYETILRLIHASLFLIAISPLYYLTQDVLKARRIFYNFNKIFLVSSFVILVLLHTQEGLMMAYYTVDNLVKNLNDRKWIVDTGYMECFLMYLHATAILRMTFFRPKIRKHDVEGNQKEKVETIAKLAIWDPHKKIQKWCMDAVAKSESPKKKLILDTIKTMPKRKWSGNRSILFWCYRCFISIYVWILFFDLILVVMVAIGLPFYMYPIKIVVRDFLSFIVWYFYFFKRAKCNQNVIEFMCSYFLDENHNSKVMKSVNK